MKEALKLALEALEDRSSLMKWQKARNAIEEALSQPEQEPVVGTKTWFEDGKVVTQNLYHSDVYTTPQQRKPLTDEQIMGIARITCIGISPHEDTLNFARVIEAAHGIKE
jgi:hypothetical protein